MIRDHFGEVNRCSKDTISNELQRRGGKWAADRCASGRYMSLMEESPVKNAGVGVWRGPRTGAVLKQPLDMKKLCC